MKLLHHIRDNHIAALTSLDTTRFDRRILLVLLGVSGVGMALVASIFGDTLLTFVQQSDSATSVPVAATLLPDWFAQVMYPIFWVFDVVSELVWCLIVAFVTLRILKRVGSPLPFKQIFNIFLMIRLYELVIIATMLLAFAVAVWFGVVDVQMLLSGESQGGPDIVSFISTIGFFWVYYWSIKYIAVGNRESEIHNP